MVSKIADRHLRPKFDLIDHFEPLDVGYKKDICSVLHRMKLTVELKEVN